MGLSLYWWYQLPLFIEREDKTCQHEAVDGGRRRENYEQDRENTEERQKEKKQSKSITWTNICLGTITFIVRKMQNIQKRPITHFSLTLCKTITEIFHLPEIV